MLCENIFCVYWNDEKCILDEISLDIQGKCESCIYVNIDEKTLESYRKNLLEKFENYEK